MNGNMKTSIIKNIINIYQKQLTKTLESRLEEILKIDNRMNERTIGKFETRSILRILYYIILYNIQEVTEK